MVTFLTCLRPWLKSYYYVARLWLVLRYVVLREVACDVAVVLRQVPDAYRTVLRREQQRLIFIQHTSTGGTPEQLFALTVQQHDAQPNTAAYVETRRMVEGFARAAGLTWTGGKL